MSPPRSQGQRGLVLILALIVLAAMSLAAVGLMRGVLGSNRVAANLAYQQAATQAADVGIERAIAWLEQKTAETKAGASASSPAVNAYKLNDHIVKSADEAYNYSATRSDPGVDQTWESFWKTLEAANATNQLPTDANGNTVAFVIHRLCGSVGSPPNANCETSPRVTSGSGNSQSNPPHPFGSMTVYYRITVRVQGPRNATSFIQAVVAMTP